MSLSEIYLKPEAKSNSTASIVFPERESAPAKISSCSSFETFKNLDDQSERRVLHNSTFKKLSSFSFISEVF